MFAVQAMRKLLDREGPDDLVTLTTWLAHTPRTFIGKRQGFPEVELRSLVAEAVG